MKALIREFIEHERLGLVRYLLWLRIAIKDAAGTKQIAQSGEYSNLNIHSPLFEGDFKLKPLFILGSGRSVNDLLPEDFEHIKRGGISIGINAWALHNFVPQIYSFETGQAEEGPSPETIYVSQSLSRPEVAEADSQYLFLRPTPPAKPKNLVSLPRGKSHRRAMYGRANVVTKTRENLQADIGRIFRCALKKLTPSNVLLDNGASVVRLIWLGAMQGFSTIVLVGIDLNSGPYFWQEGADSGELNAIRKVLYRPFGKPHDSLQTLDRPFPVDVFIEELAGVLWTEKGIRLFAASSESSLSRFLPIYNWPSWSSSP